MKFPFSRTKYLIKQVDDELYAQSPHNKAVIWGERSSAYYFNHKAETESLAVLVAFAFGVPCIVVER